MFPFKRARPRTVADRFHGAFRGSFTSLMQWAQLDEFRATVQAKADAGWYIYCIGEPVPAQRFLKGFDPHNLGVACGASKNPPHPGWTLSLLPPALLDSKRPLPEGRRRWWQGLCA